jgi:hypothetical protein
VGERLSWPTPRRLHRDDVSADRPNPFGRIRAAAGDFGDACALLERQVAKPPEECPSPLLATASIGSCRWRCALPPAMVSAAEESGSNGILPHLHRDWARPCPICTRTWIAPPTSTPGLGPPHHICTGAQVTGSARTEDCLALIDLAALRYICVRIRPPRPSPVDGALRVRSALYPSGR